jgi:hypothetical protein
MERARDDDEAKCRGRRRRICYDDDVKKRESSRFFFSLYLKPRDPCSFLLPPFAPAVFTRLHAFSPRFYLSNRLPLRRKHDWRSPFFGSKASLNPFGFHSFNRRCSLFATPNFQLLPICLVRVYIYPPFYTLSPTSLFPPSPFVCLSVSCVYL